MKYVLFAGCIWALLSASQSRAHADEPATRSRVQAGVLVGLNISSSLGRECTVSCEFTEFDPEATLQTGDKFTGGAYLTYALDRRYRVRVEARFAVKGVKAAHLGGARVFLDDGTAVDAALFYTLNHSMRYIQVPVLVQRDFHYDGAIRPHALVGLSLGYLVSASADGTGTLIDEFNRTVGQAKGKAAYGDAHKKFDLAAVVGAGLSFPLPRGALEFGVRYELGVLPALDGLFSTSLEADPDIYQPGTAEPDPTALVDNAPLTAESMRHHVLTLTVGYQF